MANLELETDWWDFVKWFCCGCGFGPCQSRPALPSSPRPDTDDKMEEEASSSAVNYPAPHVIFARHLPGRRFSNQKRADDEEYAPVNIPPRKYVARSPRWGSKRGRSSFVDSLGGREDECKITVIPVKVQVEQPPSSSNIATTHF